MRALDHADSQRGTGTIAAQQEGEGSLGKEENIGLWQDGTLSGRSTLDGQLWEHIEPMQYPSTYLLHFV